MSDSGLGGLDERDHRAGVRTTLIRFDWPGTSQEYLRSFKSRQALQRWRLIEVQPVVLMAAEASGIELRASEEAPT